MKRMVLLVCMLFAGVIFGDVKEIDTSKWKEPLVIEGRYVWYVFVCDWKSEVVLLPVVKDRGKVFDDCKEETIEMKKPEGLKWVAYYLVRVKESDPKVVIYHYMSETADIYRIY